jgi:hypothetical protein
MQRKQRLFFICLVVAGLSLMASFYLFNRLLLALAALLPVGCMVFGRRSTRTWLAHLSLASFAGLSAIGVLLKIPLIPMALASTAALAAWDFVLEMHTESPPTELYDRFHFVSLATALGLGLLVIGIFQRFHFRLPFGAMLVLGIVMLVCLNRIMNYIPQNMESHR